MSVLEGPDMLIRVETAVAGTFIDVADLNSYSTGNTREKAKFPVFGAAAHRTTGERTKTFSLGGFLNSTDPGQLRIRSLEATDTPVKIRVLPDGVNGFEITCLINSTGHEASAEETSLQTFTVECEATTDPSPIGGGTAIVV